uniref:Uncharacterized protein n=4 Tax=Vibrio TaxID=662 RepID=A0A0H3ZMC5_9VIBR|nr:hypothetical protein [Vibrio sp. ZF_53]AKN37418.1 hypothetical protein [Vibrio tasmaniensis]AKN39338.1 hypothetical protein [Vibrio sp. ZF_45]AKN39746.1 hypothetical protein [Vibrio splendidus]
MAVPKTTDLSTVDQLAALREIQHKIDSISFKLNGILPALELFSVITTNSNTKIEDGSMRLIDLFNKETIGLLVGGFFFTLNTSSLDLIDLRSDIDERIFKLEEGV